MNSPDVIERTGGYLHSQFRETKDPWGHAPSSTPFITLSRQAGSGGSSLARLLARKLNAESAPGTVWRVFEGNVTARMLIAHRLSPSVARYLPEDKVPELAATIGELVGLHPNLWELTQKTNEAMRQLASAGHVILVGRGANFATADLPHGLHVRLVATENHRARYLAQLYNISEAEARTRNATCDTARRRYVRTHFNADVGDPTAYSLCINTGEIPLSEAAGLIQHRVHALASASG